MPEGGDAQALGYLGYPQLRLSRGSTSTSLLSGIRNELEAVETPERNYECTIAFCGLLRVLLCHGPSVVPLHTLGAATRAPGSPAGIGPHVRFVLDTVLLPARSRPVAHSADRLRVAAAALGVLYDCVRNYAIVSPPPPLQRQSAVPAALGAAGRDGTTAPLEDSWIPGDPRWDFVDPEAVAAAGFGLGAFSVSGAPPPRSLNFEVMRALLSSSHGGETDDLLSVVLSVLGPPPGDSVLDSARTRDAAAGYHVGVLALTAATGGAGGSHIWTGAGASSGGASALETEASAQADWASSAAIAKRTLVVTHARERMEALQRAATAAAGAGTAAGASTAAATTTVSPSAWMALTTHEDAAALVFAGGGPDLASSMKVRAGSRERRSYVSCSSPASPCVSLNPLTLTTSPLAAVARTESRDRGRCGSSGCACRRGGGCRAAGGPLC